MLKPKFLKETGCCCLMLRGERFKKIKLPEHLNKVNTLNLTVCDHDGKLSVMYSQLKGGFSGKEMERCEIWVKEEYSVGTSWCQVINLDLGSDISLGWIQRLRKNRDQVLGFTKRVTLVSYDPSTKEYKRLGFRGRWRSWSTCDFTESLILLDKKLDVGTYKDAGSRMKKRFTCNIDRYSHAQTMDEHEVEVGDEDEGPTDNTIYYLSVVYTLMKF
ncbi:uncharacterized protein LOC141653822 [Silene latifolia]|uniref:uncharacterized protein LOC141653822 n=1 Tax=Silene latifolia TaxID=37657 RepID=UPI003D76F502